MALTDAAKKTYEAQLLAANPPTAFGGKNNQGSFADNSARDAVKKYYADLNKQQDDLHKKKVADINDEANKYLSVAQKSQKAAAALAKSAGLDFFDGTEDPPKVPQNQKSRKCRPLYKCSTGVVISGANEGTGANRRVKRKKYAAKR